MAQKERPVLSNGRLRAKKSDEDNDSIYQLICFFSDSEQSRKKKFGRRSINWKYFELVDAVNKIAKCNACGRELSFSTVSNLKKHLARKHSNIGTLAEYACSSEETQFKRFAL